jgi:hypothetical protein
LYTFSPYAAIVLAVILGSEERLRCTSAPRVFDDDEEKEEEEEEELVEELVEEDRV